MGDISFREVVYSDFDKESIIRQTIETYLGFAKANPPLSEESVVNQFAEALIYHSCFFKDKYFAEEREYRLAHIAKQDASLDLLRFREGSKGIVPYLPLNLRGNGLDINSIRVGARFDFDRNEKAIAMGLRESGRAIRSEGSLQ